MFGSKLDVTKNAMPPIAPRMRVDSFKIAVKYLQAAEGHEQLLVALRQKLRLTHAQVDLDTDAGTAAARVASAAVQRVILQAALEEAAGKKAAALIAAADATADMAAEATSDMMRLWAKAADMDAKEKSLEMHHDPLGAALTFKVAKHPFLPMAAAIPRPQACWTSASPVGSTPCDVEAGSSPATTHHSGRQPLQTKVEKVKCMLRCRLDQLKMLEVQLRSQADDVLKMGNMHRGTQQGA